MYYSRLGGTAGLLALSGDLVSRLMMKCVGLAWYRGFYDGYHVELLYVN